MLKLKSSGGPSSITDTTILPYGIQYLQIFKLYVFCMQ
jgi:hypothetical protein